MSLLRKIVESVNAGYTGALVRGGRLFYRHFYGELLKRHPVGKVAGEADYVEKWRPLSRKPHLAPYRLFSQYIGPDPNIVPEDISATIIQPLLNPAEYRAYYQDKNMFDKILSPDIMPATLMRGIGGMDYDAEYALIEDAKPAIDEISRTEERIFIKPSVDSSSGDSVVGFSRGKDGLLYSMEDGKAFDEVWLANYKADNPDYIVQRGLSQHKDIARFNPSSINTIRVATYRSVIDDKPHFLSALIRIGKTGSFVDNAHAGGLFVGIDRNGVLGKYACDQYGNRYETFNGINFRDDTYVIPDFEKIIQFSESVASQILHARLVAQDICIEADGQLKLVEFNLRAFSMWLFQFTSGVAFGDYTDEIIRYCAENRKRVRKVIVEPF